MHDLGRGVPLAPSSQPTFNGRRRTSGRLRHSSRRCNPSLKDDVIERSPASPRATRRVTKLSPPMTRCTAGHVSPLASLVDCNLARVEIGRVSHDARFSNALGRLSHFRSLHVTLIRTASKNRGHKITIETRCGGREHARTATLSHRVRSEFGCWKLQETRPRCRLRAGRKPRTARR